MKSLSLLLAALIMLPAVTHADESLYGRFYGHYTGEARLDDGHARKLDVTISRAKKKGFNITWETVSLDVDGKSRTKSYSIDFLPSDREGIYGSAMKTNLFGGQEPLDPLKGEPYFWARIRENTLTVYGMLIRTDGGYEIQRYDRMLNGDEMIVDYTRFAEGASIRHITATLKRADTDAERDRAK